MNFDFLRFFYKTTNDTLLIDGISAPPKAFPIIFRNSVNICYINTLVHILRKFDIFKSPLIESKIDTQFAKDLKKSLNIIQKDFKTHDPKIPYFLQEFKNTFQDKANEYIKNYIGIPYPQLQMTKQGGVMLKLLGSLCIPSLTIPTSIDYISTSQSHSIRSFYYYSQSVSYRSIKQNLCNNRMLIPQSFVQLLKQHVTSCGNITIPTDDIFNINFNHEIDSPYHYSNHAGLGISSNYLILDHISTLLDAKIHPDYVKYYQTKLSQLISSNVYTITNGNIIRNTQFRMIEQGIADNLDTKQVTFYSNDTKVSLILSIHDMTYYRCSTCGLVFPCILEQHRLHATSTYLIYNKYRNKSITDTDITKPIILNSKQSKPITYNPIAFSCAFSTNIRLQRGHIITITKESDNNWYLYEDERIPIRCDPNKFNKTENELIIFYKLQ
jgi:hypothetical protein